MSLELNATSDTTGYSTDYVDSHIACSLYRKTAEGSINYVLTASVSADRKNGAMDTPVMRLEGTWNQTNLTLIHIPDCVTEIGVGAFSYCEGLTSISTA